MRIPLTLILPVAILCPLIDIYIYKVLGRLRRGATAWRWLHIIIAVAAYALLITAVAMPRRGGDDAQLTAIMWMLFTFLSIYASKALFTVIDLFSLIPCLFCRRRPTSYYDRPARGGRASCRFRPVTWLGATLGLLLFGGMWYGALIGRFRTQVREVTVTIPGLPPAFDGYRIAQLSDLHTGTFGSDTTFTARIVDRTNSLRPDLIVFTGDIVNRRSEELAPHIAPLSRLTATDGVTAILGNHDYGDYYNWPSDKAKADNMDLLVRSLDRAGWRLLLNETQWLRRGQKDSLALIGVENIGDPPFHSYGSLDKAYPAGAPATPKILLSHNPAHWHNDIAGSDSYKDIALTLAGHTHAMQIELLGLSPAAWRYPEWGGLYTDPRGRHLYVNIGAGTVGLPMRLGATPEITLITLKGVRN